jgi:hypothetical protein
MRFLLSDAPGLFPVAGKPVDSIYAEPPAGRVLADDGAAAMSPGVVF